MRRMCWLAASVVLLSGLPHVRAEAAQRWAVLIGISKYSDEKIPFLLFPEGDAVKMQEALATYCGVRPDHMRVLTSRDASYVNIKAAFEQWLIPKVGPEDLAFIYFSGHGSQIDDDDEAEEADRLDEVVLPYDAQAGVEASSIRDDQIETWLSKLRCQHIVMIWDSCQLGNRSKGFAFTPTHRARGDETKEEMAQDFGQYAFLSAVQEGEEAWESPNLKSGVFTHFVLQSLKGQADKPPHGNQDGSVTVAEMGSYVAAEASQFSTEHCRAAQHPQLVVRDEQTGATALTAPWPQVVRVAGEVATINVGAADGVRSGEGGDVFSVYPESTTPQTAQAPIGELQVVEAVEQRATAKILSGADQVKPGCKLHLKVREIARLTAVIRVNSMPSAEVLLDGVRRGETPIKLRDAPGEHKLTLKLGDIEWSTSLRLSPGEEKAVSHRF